MKISEIWIYPVKSLGGIRLNSAIVEEKGLQYDRRWMVVDENGVFITQRTDSKMALIDVALDTDALVLTSRMDNSQIKVPFHPISARQINVKIFQSHTTGITVDDRVDLWLSEQLGKNLQLVFMPEWVERKADPQYAKNNENVSFADGYPYLIISQASLDQLNDKLEAPLTMRRFRPNFIFTGSAPHEEDQWKEVRVGQVKFEIVKPCSRCVLTTVDPETGSAGKEPLKTLATYRLINKKILFGQNMVATDLGTVTEQDEVIVLQKQ